VLPQNEPQTKIKIKKSSQYHIYLVRHVQSSMHVISLSQNLDNIQQKETYPKIDM